MKTFSSPLFPVGFLLASLLNAGVSPVSQPVTVGTVAVREVPSIVEHSPGPNVQMPMEAQDLWHRLRGGFTLPMPEGSEDKIRRYEHLYSTQPQYFEVLADRAYWVLPYILNQVEKRGMPSEIAILPAVESGFRAEATSKDEAAGMWQFIDSTGKRFGLRQDWWMDGRRDLVHSTRAALDYLEFLFREFNGDWHLALAAYNTGEGAIHRKVKENIANNEPTNYSSLALYKETTVYLPKLFAIRNIIQNPQKYGVELPPLPNIQTLTVVDARIQTDLAVAASLIPVSESELANWNMGYKRGVTPRNGPHHIVVPTVYARALTAGLGNLGLQKRQVGTRYQVREGEYLGKIAAKHDVTVASIREINGLDSDLIYPDQELIIPIYADHEQYAKASVGDIEIQDGDQLYTIQQGDSLWKISRRMEIPLEMLLRWNGISKTSLLIPGRKIIIHRPS